jgi:hypothetical protein
MAEGNTYRARRYGTDVFILLVLNAKKAAHKIALISRPYTPHM